jgi:hypothetical protein
MQLFQGNPYRMRKKYITAEQNFFNFLFDCDHEWIIAARHVKLCLDKRRKHTYSFCLKSSIVHILIFTNHVVKLYQSNVMYCESVLVEIILVKGSLMCE